MRFANISLMKEPIPLPTEDEIINDMVMGLGKKSFWSRNWIFAGWISRTESISKWTYENRGTTYVQIRKEDEGDYKVIDNYFYYKAKDRKYTLNKWQISFTPIMYAKKRRYVWVYPYKDQGEIKYKYKAIPDHKIKYWDWN